MPQGLKAANVVPISKQHPLKSVQNNLWSMLTPALSKVLESLVVRWIMGEIIMHKSDFRQFGVLKGRSTTHVVFDILHMWLEALYNYRSLKTLFIGYSKALIHVDHITVLNKMVALAVQLFLLMWVHSFLFETRQWVKIQDMLNFFLDVLRWEVARHRVRCWNRPSFSS